MALTKNTAGCGNTRRQECQPTRLEVRLVGSSNLQKGGDKGKKADETVLTEKQRRKSG